MCGVIEEALTHQVPCQEQGDSKTEAADPLRMQEAQKPPQRSHSACLITLGMYSVIESNIACVCDFWKAPPQ